MILAGDSNARLGKTKENKSYQGKYTIGKRNANGTRLAEFLEQHRYIAINTCFSHPMAQLITWIGPYLQKDKNT